jgi:hypothetical protein
MVGVLPINQFAASYPQVSEWSPVEMGLAATLCFHFVLVATLCFRTERRASALARSDPALLSKTDPCRFGM